MEVDLTGGDKIVVIQPTPYYGPDILTSPGAPSTNLLIGTVSTAHAWHLNGFICLRVKAVVVLVYNIFGEKTP